MNLYYTCLTKIFVAQRACRFDCILLLYLACRVKWTYSLHSDCFDTYLVTILHCPYIPLCIWFGNILWAFSIDNIWINQNHPPIYDRRKIFSIYRHGYWFPLVCFSQSFQFFPESFIVFQTSVPFRK